MSSSTNTTSFAKFQLSRNDDGTLGSKSPTSTRASTGRRSGRRGGLTKTKNETNLALFRSTPGRSSASRTSTPISASTLTPTDPATHATSSLELVKRVMKEARIRTADVSAGSREILPLCLHFGSVLTESCTISQVLVSFTYPSEFTQLQGRVTKFKVSPKWSVSKILLKVGGKVEELGDDFASAYHLCTQSGVRLHDKTCLANYGVGTLVKKWALTFVKRDPGSHQDWVEKRKAGVMREPTSSSIASPEKPEHGRASILIILSHKSFSRTLMRVAVEPLKSGFDVVKSVLEVLDKVEWNPRELSLHYFARRGIQPLNSTLPLLSYGFGTTHKTWQILVRTPTSISTGARDAGSQLGHLGKVLDHERASFNSLVQQQNFEVAKMRKKRDDAIAARTNLEDELNDLHAQTNAIATEIIENAQKREEALARFASEKEKTSEIIAETLEAAGATSFISQTPIESSRFTVEELKKTTVEAKSQKAADDLFQQHLAALYTLTLEMNAKVAETDNNLDKIKAIHKKKTVDMEKKLEVDKAKANDLHAKVTAINLELEVLRDSIKFEKAQLEGGEEEEGEGEGGDGKGEGGQESTGFSVQVEVEDEVEEEEEEEEEEEGQEEVLADEDDDSESELEIDEDFWDDMEEMLL